MMCCIEMCCMIEVANFHQILLDVAREDLLHK